MYRRANLTGVNPLVYYLGGEPADDPCVRATKGWPGTCTHAKTRVYLVLRSFLMGIYDLVISSYFDSRRLSFFTVGLLDRAPAPSRTCGFLYTARGLTVTLLNPRCVRRGIVSFASHFYPFPDGCGLSASR